ncbi:MAG: DUF1934 domain-containing protein [Acutalibacteraceae bacterium]|nr:DUF1934 domain-containing protein [Acutalibacteraceae bacterium]
MTNVSITVNGCQLIDGQKDIISTKTVGKLGFRNNKYLIKYNEQDEDGNLTQTQITVYDSQATLKRSGATVSTMLIEKGRNHPCSYSVNGITLDLNVMGKNVKNNLGLNGGVLTLEYSIYSGNALLSENTTEIILKEV